MSNHCVDCGSPIGSGQRTCSMCYGDPDHGSDGYYRQWQEEQRRAEEEMDALEKLAYDDIIGPDNDEFSK